MKTRYEVVPTVQRIDESWRSRCAVRDCSIKVSQLGKAHDEVVPTVQRIDESWRSCGAVWDCSIKVSQLLPQPF